jgi:hypothetical protein
MRVHSHAAQTTAVAVTATEFKFKLSKSSVPHGKAVFTLVNKSKLSHDFCPLIHADAESDGAGTNGVLARLPSPPSGGILDGAPLRFGWSRNGAIYTTGRHADEEDRNGFDRIERARIPRST